MSLTDRNGMLVCGQKLIRTSLYQSVGVWNELHGFRASLLYVIGEVTMEKSSRLTPEEIHVYIFPCSVLLGTFGPFVVAWLWRPLPEVKHGMEVFFFFWLFATVGAFVINAHRRPS